MVVDDGVDVPIGGPSSIGANGFESKAAVAALTASPPEEEVSAPVDDDTSGEAERISYVSVSYISN